MSLEKTSAAPGTTNDDAPFQPGERVQWNGSAGATVLTNDGEGGVVDFNGHHVDWDWNAWGIPARRVNP